MLMFTLAISCVTHFQFTLIHGPNTPGSYATLIFTALEFTSITSPIHKWVLFLLCLHLFILLGVMSPPIFSSILGTYRPGEFIFMSYLLTFSYCSWGSQDNIEVVCHFLFQGTTKFYTIRISVPLLTNIFDLQYNLLLKDRKYLT